MGRLVFGSVAPCRPCHGTGQRVLAMTDQEKRGRNREIWRQKRSLGEMYEVEDRVSPLKPCPDCGGKGHVAPSEADRDRILSETEQ